MEDVKAIREKKLKPTQIKEEDRDYYLERRYPAYGNLVPRDVASRAAKERCDAGYGVNATGEAVYLDFSTAIQRYGREKANMLGLENPTAEKITQTTGPRETTNPLKTRFWGVPPTSRPYTRSARPSRPRN